WPRPERQLHQGRGALRAEPGFRLLLPSPLQRAAVSEPRDAAAAVEPANSELRGAAAAVEPANGAHCCAEARIEAGSPREWQTAVSCRHCVICSRISLVTMTTRRRSCPKGCRSR